MCRPCAIVPSYNHCSVIGDVIAELRRHDLTVILVDDGSRADVAAVLSAFHAPENGVIVEHLSKNQGKGGAVSYGLRLAHSMGYSHAFQVDADGQHDLSLLPLFLGESSQFPQALISGRPVYDGSMPRARAIGRWFTHVWVWIETLSFDIPDSMCGFRIYPLDSTIALLNQVNLGLRMDFDPEILVRLHWEGVRVRTLPIPVRYPEGNTSNFDVVRDNVLISQMHTMLVFGMLRRLPSLLWRKVRGPDQQHWANIDERGMKWGMWFVTLVYRTLGYRFCLIFLQPILFYFFLTGSKQRQAILQFWQRLEAEGSALPVRYPAWRVWLQYRAFGRMVLDKISAWTGGVSPDQLILPLNGDFQEAATIERGIFVMTSHLGNAEICRALAHLSERDLKVTVFVHTANAVKFNQILAEFAPESAVDVMEVNTIGPDTAIDLERRIAAGEWIVMAGDRVSVKHNKRVSRLSFLGQEAVFAHGPVILAALLRCPVYMLMCVRVGREHRLIFDKLTDQVVLPRGRKCAAQKTKAITEYLRAYVDWLEDGAKKHPTQWFNFFNFWQ